MHEEREKEHLPTSLSLEKVENLKRWNILVKKKGLDQERREKYWGVWVRSDTGWTSNIYKIKHLDRSRGIEELSRKKSQ